MVGSGIFFTTSTLARQYGAPPLLAGFLVVAAACALTALRYSEFASLESERRFAIPIRPRAFQPRPILDNRLRPVPGIQFCRRRFTLDRPPR